MNKFEGIWFRFEPGSTVLEAEKLVHELEQMNDFPDVSIISQNQPSTSTGKNIFII